MSLQILGWLNGCCHVSLRIIPWTPDLLLSQYSRTGTDGVSVDRASTVAAPKSDPVFLHVKAGMTVIVADMDAGWRMADVIWVDGAARSPKVPTLFQVADVYTGVINWINSDLLTHICPRGLAIREH